MKLDVKFRETGAGRPSLTYIGEINIIKTVLKTLAFDAETDWPEAAMRHVARTILALIIAAGILVFVDVLPAYEDLALGRLQQGVEVLDKGGLARAGMPDDPHELPLRDREADVLYGDFFKGSPRAVYVAQILHTDL